MIRHACRVAIRATALVPLLLASGFLLTSCDSDNKSQPQAAAFQVVPQLCSIEAVSADAQAERTFPVYLPDLDDPASSERIRIPDGRPAYALLVSGFHQNRDLDMFHFYAFAKSLMKKGAYVHFAWWNNLLAPYMERPLHNVASIPSTGPIPWGELTWLISNPPITAKAIPNDDFQFQADAIRLLRAIRRHNPQAAIILVGHSMGGDAVARLAYAADLEGIEIALLAPIDPVGNRSCIYSPPSEILGIPGFDWCDGLTNLTRWRATHLEILDIPDDGILFNPPRRNFSDNIKYLYHRWQQEFTPPFDFMCPDEGSSIIPCMSFKPESEYLFGHPDDRALSIYAGSTNVQAEVLTDLQSALDVVPPTPTWNNGGLVDGHGEIVGFRGLMEGFLETDSYPMALKAQGNWPIGLDKVNKAQRVALMKQWEADHNYLRNKGYEPQDPSLCMVSGDMSDILRVEINLQPNADAGPDTVVLCTRADPVTLTLDGSASSDPDKDPLTFTWEGPFGTLHGVTIDVDLGPGEHTIQLTVDDGRGKTDTDTVVVRVGDA